MPEVGLDVEKLGILRRWGSGLQADPREEVAAAGRAITLLIEEIERLHVLVWDRRLYPDVPVPDGSTEPETGAAATAEPPARTRLGRLRRAAQQKFPQADPQAESASEPQLPEDRQQPGAESEEGPSGSPFPV